MKTAYKLLQRTRDAIKKSDGTHTIASVAGIAGVNDGWLRRLIAPDTKHKTLDMLAQLEKAVEGIEAKQAKPTEGE